MKKTKDRKQMGFKQALEYILDLFCYAYYVKADNLVSDKTFDELEKVYITLFDKGAAPLRGIENGMAYTNGVHIIYEYLKEKKNEK